MKMKIEHVTPCKPHCPLALSETELLPPHLSKAPTQIQHSTTQQHHKQSTWHGPTRSSVLMKTLLKIMKPLMMLEIAECFQDKANPPATGDWPRWPGGHACASNMARWGPGNRRLISSSRCRRESETIAFVKAWRSARMLSLKATDYDRKANRDPATHPLLIRDDDETPTVPNHLPLLLAYFQLLLGSFLLITICRMSLYPL